MAKHLGAVRFGDGQLAWFIWNGTVDTARPRLFATQEAAEEAWDDPQHESFQARPGGEPVDVLPLYSSGDSIVFFRSRAERDSMLLIGPLSLDAAWEEQHHDGV